MSTPTALPRSRFAKRTQPSSPNVTACIRCRQRKKRCDQKMPRCSLCESAQVDCVIHDAVMKRTVPRSYVYNLEERVAFLELKLREHGIQEYDTTVTTSLPYEVVSLPQLPPPVVEAEIICEALSVDHVSAAQKTVDEVLNLVQHSARQEPVFSKLLLAELMRPERTRRVARVWEPQTSQEVNHLFDMVNGLDTSLAPLPDKKGAQYLTKIYFEFANDCYPLLHEPTFRDKLEQLYKASEPGNISGAHTSHKSGLNVFFVFMVFAMALLVLQKNNVTGVPTSLCDRYHKTALRALKEEGLPADVEGVQALLLIAQYSYHHPNIHGVWKTIGMALRLSVELGLHQDPPVGKLDFLTLDTMRRTFWVAYSMDRNIAIASGLPSCLSDGSITAKFPTDIDDEFIKSDGISDPSTASRGLKSFSIYFFRYRQFQSEIQTILYEERCPALPPIDYQQWQKGMYERLKAWYDCLPRDHLPGKSELNTVIKPDVWELAFHRALLNLYHPSPRIPSLSEPALLALAKSSCKVIQIYRRFFLENRVTIFWQAVENLFSAGTALLFCYINSEQVQQSLNLQSLETNIHTCSSVLWGMVERFPAYKAKRDAFDIIATKTLADLNSNAEMRNSLLDINFSRTNPGAPDHNYPLSGGWNNDRNDFSSPPFTTQTSSMNKGASQPPITSTTPVADETIQTEQSQDSNIDSSNSYTPQISNESTQRFFDLNEISIDWEAFENANEFIPSTWL